MSDIIDYEKFRKDDGSLDLVAAWRYLNLAISIQQNEKAIKWLEDCFAVVYIDGHDGIKTVLTNALLESLGLL